MSPDEDGIEPFDPAENPADTTAEFEDDDRDEDEVEDGTPALALPVGGDIDA